MKSLGGDAVYSFMADDREGRICAYKSLIFKENRPLGVSIFLAEGNYITSLKKKQSQVTDVILFFFTSFYLGQSKKRINIKRKLFSLGI